MVKAVPRPPLAPVMRMLPFDMLDENRFEPRDVSKRTLGV